MPETPETPEIPEPPEDADGGSYLVPFSFHRLDSFTGYQSGMPSPGYYQRLWEGGPAAAGAALTESVVARLRKRGQHVSTADLIAARATAEGLALIRGHRHPARTDLLDGLACALLTDALDQPLPWTGRGTLTRGTHPLIVEIVAALSGDRVGRLHPDTPLPPLVHEVGRLLANLGLDTAGSITLDLARPEHLERSRTLHRLRVLEIPGFHRDAGPDPGADAAVTEQWTLGGQSRLTALIEAGAYGPSLVLAAAAALDEKVGADSQPTVGALAAALGDAVLCGLDQFADRVLAAIAAALGHTADLAGVGRFLRIGLTLWRYDPIFGAARSTALAAALSAAARRALWLVEGVQGPSATADPGRLSALTAVRDLLRQESVLRQQVPALQEESAQKQVDAEAGFDRESAIAVMRRIAASAAAPPDLRGAAYGFCWSLGATVPDPVPTLRAAALPATLGDWLAGLFALAREQVLEPDVLNPEPDILDPEDPEAPAARPEGLLAVLDQVVAAMGEEDFLIALPALRQAFAYFPPRDRAHLAQLLLDRHEVRGSGRDLLRLGADPVVTARGRVLDRAVDDLLAREGLL